MSNGQRYTARLAGSATDLEAAQRLRHAAFIEGTGAAGRLGGRDEDAFDSQCQHFLVEDAASGRLWATFRILPLESGAEIGRSYSAQFYDLGGLGDYPGPMLEMGRFCVDPCCRDPEVLRAAWGALAAFAARERTGLLFGCASFHGTDADAYSDAFAMLRERHLAPKRWLPRIKAANVFRFAQRLRRRPDRARALKTMPPLLRSYLSLGGWVSDHAVVDKDLNTLHVFTGLEVVRIPAARARTLLAVASRYGISANRLEC